MENKYNVPIWEKVTLTVREAQELTGITEKKLRVLCYANPNVCIKVGNAVNREPKILVKREPLIELINTLTILN